MPNIHPALTHFPIALLTFSLLFDIISVLLGRVDFERIGFWTQLLGVAGLGATIVSGLLARSGLSIHEPADQIIQLHQQVAFSVAVLASILLLWRIGVRFQIPQRRRNLYLLLSFATVLLLWVGAWYGGELVYGFGVGVKVLAR